MTRFIRQLCGLLTAFALAVSIVIPAHADQDELLSVDEESAAMGEGYYIELPEESAEDSQTAPTDPDAAAQADPPSGKRD